MIPILFAMLLLPLAGVLVALIARRWASGIAIGVSLLELIIFLLAAWQFANGGKIVESYTFIPAINVNFELILNNITFVFTLLSVAIFLAVSIASNFFVSEERTGYNLLLMLAEAGVLGLFLSGNLFILYLFWDFSIVALFFMLFHFGGYDRRYASLKFIIYSIFSSSLLLIGIMLIYFYLPSHSFEIAQLMSTGYMIPKNAQLLILVLLLFAFMIKMPVFPFHSWAPDAYSEAPPGGAMLLAGVLSKFGIYGLIILFVSLPLAKEYALYIAILFVLSSVYGAATALGQKNLKRMLSYLSISEIGIIGFTIATMNTLGMSGALFGSLSHALIISLLFLLAFVIEKLFGTSIISRLGALIKRDKLVSYLFLFGIFAAIGLPLTSGFVTDLLIFLGGAKSFGILILVPATAIIINASYLFWTYKKIFLAGSEAEMFDLLDKNAKASMILLVLLIIFIGVFPPIILNSIGAAI